MATSTTTAVKVGNKKEGLVASLVGLEDATKKVLRLSQEVKEAEGIIDELRRLQSEVRQKEKLLAEQQQLIADKDIFNKGLVDTFKANAAEWDRERRVLQDNLQAVKAEQKTKRKLTQALESLTKAEAEVKRKDAQLAKAKAQAEGLGLALDKTRAQLGELKDCIGLIEPDNDL